MPSHTFGSPISLAVALCLSVAGCGGATPDPMEEFLASIPDALEVASSTGPFVVFADPYGNGTPNPAAGITGQVHAVKTGSGKTHVMLHAKGIVPRRTFGAHAHVLPCAEMRGGAHYQNVLAPPPVPATDPAYGNAQNEIWLDFTTNPDGVGHSKATVQWLFRAGGARSVVIHDHATETGGVAGARLSCVDVSF